MYAVWSPPVKLGFLPDGALARSLNHLQEIRKKSPLCMLRQLPEFPVTL
jgi:hypothetical protein